MTADNQPDLAAKASEVLAAADRAGVKLALAESCTGGLLAALLTDVEGLSHVLERGFVVYSNEAKCDLLGIERAFVDEHGAVSREVALAMARGALARSEAQIAVSVTGFAGPGGPNDEEGLVHLAVARDHGPTLHSEEHFGAVGRDAVREATLKRALAMLAEALEA
jgi:nicotinamide-nucleotide amidase